MLRVLWLRESIDDLAAVWLDADSETRAQITQATELVDAELRSNPYHLSESRAEGVAVTLVAVVASGTQVHREGSAAAGLRSVYWTRAVPLASGTTGRFEGEQGQYLLHGDFVAEPVEVDARHG